MHYTNTNLTNDFNPKKTQLQNLGNTLPVLLCLTGRNTAFRRKWSRHLFSIENIYLLRLYTVSLQYFGLHSVLVTFLLL